MGIQFCRTAYTRHHLHILKASDLTALLHRSESETLDFKSKQYPFAGASDEVKSELLKDILAMANAWKESNAYIVIGVEEEHGRAKRVCGADVTLGDSDVQQFVTSKTNHPISFHVEVLTHKGLKVTVIKIDREQERPIFLRKNFGWLKSKTVYLRRGSSTDEADPDVIADMGREESIGLREAEKTLAKKEQEARFWRDFKVFLPKLVRKAFHLQSTAQSHISDAIFEYRLPLDEAKNFLRQAKAIDLDSDFRNKFAKIVDDIGIIDDYMNKGSETFKKWYVNLRSTLENVHIAVIEMEKQIRGN